MNDLYDYTGTFKQSHHKLMKANSVWERNKTLWLNLVKEVRQIHPDMGSRSIHLLTQPEGIGINRFEKLVRENGLGLIRKKKTWRTTDSRHHYHRYPNLTNGLELTDVNQLWVTDITYYLGGKQVFFIVFIMDVYSRRILGYKTSDNMFLENNLQALNDSFKIRKMYYYDNLIHHSDKGSQYCSHSYIQALNNVNCKISMAENSVRNAYAERLNGIIKNKYLAYRDITSLKSFQDHTKKSVEAYNMAKPHEGLGGKSPVAFEQYIKTIEIGKRPVTKVYDFASQG